MSALSARLTAGFRTRALAALTDHVFGFCVGSCLQQFPYACHMALLRREMQRRPVILRTKTHTETPSAPQTASQQRPKHDTPRQHRLDCYRASHISPEDGVPAHARRRCNATTGQHRFNPLFNLPPDVTGWLIIPPPIDPPRLVLGARYRLSASRDIPIADHHPSAATQQSRP